MKAVSFESLFMSNKTWLSRIIWSCLLLISIGFVIFILIIIIIIGIMVYLVNLILVCRQADWYICGFFGWNLRWFYKTVSANEHNKLLPCIHVSHSGGSLGGVPPLCGPTLLIPCLVMGCPLTWWPSYTWKYASHSTWVSHPPITGLLDPLP